MTKSSAAYPTRTWYLDLLRILATFAVVMIHTNPYSSAAALPLDSAYWAGTLISSACRFAVPVFFMISGALFLSPQRQVSLPRLYKRTILRMAVSYLFWSSLHALSYCIQTGKGKWSFLNELLRGHYHMWFILAITGLYILPPVIRQIVQNPAATRYLLILCLMFGFFLPRVPALLLMLNVPHADVIESFGITASQMNPLSGSYALFYFVLGHVLHTAPPKPHTRRIIMLGGAAGLLMTAGLSALHLTHTGEFSSGYFDARAVGCMMMGIAVFTLFRSRFFAYSPSPRMQRITLHVSSCSFGIYAVHVLLLEHMSWRFPPMPLSPALGIALDSLLIFILSYAVSALLHRIPVLRDWVV